MFTNFRISEKIKKKNLWCWLPLMAFDEWYSIEFRMRISLKSPSSTSRYYYTCLALLIYRFTSTQFDSVTNKTKRHTKTMSICWFNLQWIGDVISTQLVFHFNDRKHTTEWNTICNWRIRAFNGKLFNKYCFCVLKSCLGFY